jgi:hypothetical protein
MTILARLERIEKRLALPTGAGNWIRVNGALIWDPWDMGALPDHDPTPRILDQLTFIRERMEAQPGYTPPTKSELEDGWRAFEDAIERIRAQRETLRAFTRHVEAELAAGKTLAEIGDMPGRV